MEIKRRSAADRAKDREYQCTTPRAERSSRNYIQPIAAAVPAHHAEPLPSILQTANASGQPYEYTPLQDASDCIRILSLAPGRDSDPLCGEIFTCPLSKVVGYEALSYRWGEESEEKDLLKAPNIRIDDKYHKITPSLYEALCTLRFPDKRRNLWIDQVCIHQSDGKEKEEQLPLMGKIYRESQRALIWLGMPNENDEAVLSIINSYTTFWQQLSAVVESELRLIDAEATDELRATIIHMYAMKDSAELLKKNVKSVLDISHISSFQVPKIIDFFNKPWFTRTWPVQEVVLSRMKTVRCGPIELEWAYVGYFASMFIHKFPLESFQPGQIRGLFAANQLHWWERTYNGGFSLVALLRTIRNYEAHEDKDKVYGVVNMVDYNLSSVNKPLVPGAGKVRTIPGPLRPDCSTGKTALDVYHDVACYIMTREQSLDLLSFVDGGGGVAKPSWVPRWNQRERYTPLWYPGAGPINYSASIADVSGATFSLRSGTGDHLVETCHTLGIKICEIESHRHLASTDNWSTEAQYDSNLAAWINEELVMESKRFSWGRKSPSTKLLTSIAITLTAGREHPAPTLVQPDRIQQHVANFLAWIRGLKNLEGDWLKEIAKFQRRLKSEKNWSISSDDDGKNYGKVARAMCGRRTMYRATNGMLCLGPWFPWDKTAFIVILQGSKVPFMLLKDQDEVDCFNLVGACYVYGAMNNEFGDQLNGELDKFILV